MTNLPEKSAFTGQAVTQGGFKIALEQMLDSITETLGTGGGAINPSSAGAIDNMVIGGGTPKPAAFTNLTATGECNLNGIAKADLSNVSADAVIGKGVAKTDMSNVSIDTIANKGLAKTDLSNVDFSASNIAEKDLANVTEVNGALVLNEPTVFKDGLIIYDDAYTIKSQTSSAATAATHHLILPMFLGTNGYSDIDVSPYFGSNGTLPMNRCCWMQIVYFAHVYGNTSTMLIRQYNVTILNGTVYADDDSSRALGSVGSPSFSMPDVNTLRITPTTGTQYLGRVLNVIQGRTQF